MKVYFIDFHKKTYCTILQLISGRVDRAFATRTVDWGSIPVGSNQRLEKLLFMAFLLDVQQLEEQCEATIVCGRKVSK